MGDSNLAALLDSVIGLLDAGSNPVVFLPDLKGLYAKLGRRLWRS
jgi:hypothetical protein